MKRNKLLLSNQVYTKLMGDCVTAVVVEAFVDSLPLNEQAVAQENSNLSAYATNVINKMHPETLIDRAIEATSDWRQKRYLQNLQKEISAVVETATARIVNDDSLNDYSTPEVVKQAKLEDEEVEKLVKASQHAGINAVSNLVKKKMVDVIKDERDTFEKAEKIHRDIKEVIQNETDDLNDSLSDDDEETKPDIAVMEDGVIDEQPSAGELGADEAEGSQQDEPAGKMPEEIQVRSNTLESYMKLILAPTDPRQPVSVFSRLQDICMENILYTGEKYEGEIPYATMEKITLESTFPFFDLEQRSIVDDLKSLQLGLESHMDVPESEEERAIKMKKISKTSFICTICILTMLEVLKTMNLMKPDLGMVKDFVNSQPTVQNASSQDIERIERKVDAAADDVKKSVALGSLSAIETAEAKEALTSIRETLSKMKVSPAHEGMKTQILNKLTAAIECALPTKERDVRVDSAANRLREENIAGLGHSIKVLSRRPNVNSISICVESNAHMGADNEFQILRAVGFDTAGKEACDHHFRFNTASFMGDSIAEAVQECATLCDLQIGHKPVNLYFIDQGYSVPLGK